jgi:hypothetical protein
VGLAHSHKVPEIARASESIDVSLQHDCAVDRECTLKGNVMVCGRESCSAFLNETGREKKGKIKKDTTDIDVHNSLRFMVAAT